MYLIRWLDYRGVGLERFTEHIYVTTVMYSQTRLSSLKWPQIPPYKA